MFSIFLDKKEGFIQRYMAFCMGVICIPLPIAMIAAILCLKW